MNVLQLKQKSFCTHHNNYCFEKIKNVYSGV